MLQRKAFRPRLDIRTWPFVDTLDTFQPDRNLFKFNTFTFSYIIIVRIILYVFVEERKEGNIGLKWHIYFHFHVQWNTFTLLSLVYIF